MLQALDNIINRYTMYRLVVYGLSLLLVVGIFLGAGGVLFVSAWGLAFSIAILLATTYATNRLLGLAYRVPTNTESWLISALILACILPQATTVARALAVAFTGVLAMASKYILRLHGSNVFNPSAIAAGIVGVAGIAPITWWIGSPSMVLFTALAGLVILRKVRGFTLFISFALAAAGMMVVHGLVYDQTLLPLLKNLLLSWPLVFLGVFMLTEPTTLPGPRLYRVLYGVLVGAVFTSQLNVAGFGSSPQEALVVGNLFTAIFSPSVGLMLTLKQIDQIGPNLHQLLFTLPLGRSLHFVPGQYMEWTLRHKHVDARGNRRTFSIASSPTEPLVRIAIKTYQPSSTFKQALLLLKPGQTIRASRVNGNFTLPRDPKIPLVFIAGGIGITPFRSMLQYLVQTNQGRTITVLYIAATAEEFVFKDVLAAATQEVGITVHYATGRKDANYVKQMVPDLSGKMFYISGPNGLVSAYAKGLRGLGVPRRAIRTDHFAGY